MKAGVDALGGIKGLTAGSDDSLWAVSPGAVLKVKLDGTVTTVKQPVVAPTATSICQRTRLLFTNRS